MQRVTHTVRRKGKVIARAEAFGDDGSLEPQRAVSEAIRQQLKARDAAIRSTPQRYRKKKSENA
jgi:hypothetical protein